MRYEILGPLRVADGAGRSEISAPKIETVLAVLLVRADRVVTPETLTTELWGDRLPRRATACLHVYMSQLRKFLHRHRPDRAESPVATQPPGYVLRLGADELDSGIFLRLLDEGRGLLRGRRHAEACTRLESALALWRGPVLGDLRKGPILDGFAAWLREARLECLELLSEAQLTLGRHREIVERMHVLIGENPYREEYYRQLMLALFRSERPEDALRVYRAARRVLKEDLGVEPSRPLRDLHHAILAAGEPRRLYAPAS
ncbi:AfsR/SARP family transcriptional regulator [Sinosporangium siamense]|uniref:OmpR/PhoB-type domain-containing protein n=1 Tax=Sinosporangium siamense TaxID=1367973 RepID=A0A919RQ56_9ACTN|nr:AfsR/SARP family transcriptional regulator [Sinosporangium siamense]GII96174.1 hypothetical protein Ssi02_64050 [Sinosporangium siamense]